MRIMLELPDHVVHEIDAANNAARLKPPDWPFETIEVIPTSLSLIDKKKLDEYKMKSDDYHKKRGANGGKQIRSRSTLILKIITSVMQHGPTWKQISEL